MTTSNACLPLFTSQLEGHRVGEDLFAAPEHLQQLHLLQVWRIRHLAQLHLGRSIRQQQQSGILGSARPCFYLPSPCLIGVDVLGSIHHNQAKGFLGWRSCGGQLEGSPFNVYLLQAIEGWIRERKPRQHSEVLAHVLEARADEARNPKTQGTILHHDQDRGAPQEALHNAMHCDEGLPSASGRLHSSTLCRGDPRHHLLLMRCEAAQSAGANLVGGGEAPAMD
mmetsp:Transcript_27242/g.63498  ORF Transcript_27242/g.63498 Transcript_27242/m.63498 type:complete len:224 (+) Transcript_27242:1063-1734(+)